MTAATDTSHGPRPRVREGAPARGSRWDDPGDTPDEEISTSSEVPFHERVRVWTAAQVDQLPRFVTEPRPSLRQSLAHARQGAWTTAEVGNTRAWFVAHVWIIAAPIKFLAAWADWIADRPGRFWPALVIGVLLATALNGVPVVGWFVPDWAAATSWPPFSWIGG